MARVNLELIERAAANITATREHYAQQRETESAAQKQSADNAFADRLNILYRFYNHKGDLLYVGITADPSTRWPQHRRRQWWTQVATITVGHHPTRGALVAAETAAIASEQPAYNIHHRHGAR